MNPWTRLEAACAAYDHDRTLWEALMKLKPVGEAWHLIPKWTPEGEERRRGYHEGRLSARSYHFGDAPQRAPRT